MAAAATHSDDELPLLKESLARALQELDSIECIYPPPPTAAAASSSSDDELQVVIAAGPRDVLARALAEDDEGLLRLYLHGHADDARDGDGEGAVVPLLQVSVGASPCLGIALPPLYPSRGHPPRLRWKEGANRPAAERRAALLRLSEVSEAHEDCEHLLPLVAEFQAMEAERRERRQDKEEEGVESADEQQLQERGRSGSPVLKRVLVYFHHIINPTKREVVRKEAVAHALGGYAKIGWPGVVVVEGEEGDVQAYVRYLHTLRWQQITVRGEERVVAEAGQSLDDLRKMHRGFEELGQGDMGKLAAALREAGLEELFKALMK